MSKISLESISNKYSAYSLLKKYSSEYEDDIAISFYGKQISYKTLFSKIDEMAKALVSCGVKKDDVVASSLPGCPEGIYLIYAINKIGAIYCAFDCRAKNEEIKDTIKMFSPKLCFVPNFQLKEFYDIQDCNVIFINPIHALGSTEKLYSIPANFFTGRNILCMKNKSLHSYDSFICKSNNVESVNDENSSQNIFGYFYTSGTTYGRKSVVLTNDNINAAALIQKEANNLIESGQSLLNIMPLFTCYSVSLATHLPLFCGVTVKLIPLLNPKKLKQVMLKEKPNYIISVPAHWEYFIKDDFRGCDLSFVKGIIIGGDVMNPAYRIKLREIFKEHGADEPLRIGYGLSETTSTAVACFSAPEDSVGRALPHMKIAICSTETGEFLPCGEEGEICITGPTLCNGYFKEEKMSNELLRRHTDGKVWLHSGDRGYLDEEGALYFCERYKRMYVRFDGTKISPYSIEQALSACDLIKECLVVAINDAEHSHGKCAKVYIVLKKGENKEKAMITIRKFCKKHLDEHMQPKEIVFVNKLPRTENGKLDYFEKNVKK